MLPSGCDGVCNFLLMVTRRGGSVDPCFLQVSVCSLFCHAEIALLPSKLGWVSTVPGGIYSPVAPLV